MRFLTINNSKRNLKNIFQEFLPGVFLQRMDIQKVGKEVMIDLLDLPESSPEKLQGFQQLLDSILDLIQGKYKIQISGIYF